MPKLIIKQNTPKMINSATIWAIVLSMSTLAAVAWLWLKPKPEPLIQLLSHAPSAVQTDYQTTQVKLRGLVQSFETQAKISNANSPRNYHEQAVTQIDAILEQFNQLDSLVDQAQLPSETAKTLLDNHQYQRDYWDAQRHFQELRIAHFDDEAVLAGQTVNLIPETLEATPQTNDAVEAIAPVAKKFQFATPPAGAELPADFCVLGSGTCKAH